jgi:hypothetical protein
MNQDIDTPNFNILRGEDDDNFTEYSDFQTKTLTQSQPDRNHNGRNRGHVSLSDKDAHELLQSQKEIKGCLCLLLKYITENTTSNPSVDIEKTRKIISSFDFTRDQLQGCPLIPNATALELTASLTDHMLVALKDLSAKIEVIEHEHELKSQRGWFSKIFYPNS